jgi:hypothetical protein
MPNNLLFPLEVKYKLCLRFTCYSTTDVGTLSHNKAELTVFS